MWIRIIFSLHITIQQESDNDQTMRYCSLQRESLEMRLGHVAISVNCTFWTIEVTKHQYDLTILVTISACQMVICPQALDMTMYHLVD